MFPKTTREGTPEQSAVEQNRYGEICLALQEVVHAFNNGHGPVLVDMARAGEPSAIAALGFQPSPLDFVPTEASAVPNTVPDAWVAEAMATTAINGGNQ